ncbi:MAG TPA: 1-deoxy-D-xylulose-5-phosphate reductoisomerase [Oscillospiraceae bacterium]|nr:1-deoxy-D-xylulose-5-phosphate reductoisomerase [Oscillospiraceae bacterium]
MKKISILGSTGSIGKQALAVVEQYPALFCLHGLSAHRQVKELADQARLYKPAKVVIAEPSLYQELKLACSDLAVEVAAGPEALCDLAADAQHELVLNSVVGFAGLQPTLTALAAGKNVALANKESLVAGGHLVMPLAAAVNKAILPVDSEHSAIWQCLQGQPRAAVEELIVTASGGPFFDFSTAELEHVTPQAALKHPNWSMGAKITIDSATLMNKGLEVIEAHWLFDITYDKIKVVVQRESIIHSMVTFHDGAVLAQLGRPDMRVPIQYALTYPKRLSGDAPRVQWEQLPLLHFAPPDTEKFPCLQFAYEAGKIGGTLPAVMNAANEEAVRLFLAGSISFLAIPRIIESVMNKHKVIMAPEFDVLVAVDQEARKLAQLLGKRKG